MPPLFQRIRPTPHERYLGNPHKGCCTFQHFNGDPLFQDNTPSEEGPLTFPNRITKDVIAGYLPSTVSYCRWFWEKLEPTPSTYDFSLIEQSLEVCQQRGQTLAVRLMPFGGGTQPSLPAWYVEKFPTSEWTIPWSGHTILVPDYDADEYFEKWVGVHRAFGEYFDGHPLIECVDIAYIGPWGEGAGECAQTERFAKAYRDALPNTPRLALHAGTQFRDGIAAGAGWRIDCFGDCASGCDPADDHTSGHLGFDHMFDVYPRHLILSGCQDAWKTAPVFLETCHYPKYWYDQERDLDFMLTQGLKYHASYFMPKQTYLPNAWRDKFKDFCRQLGYRFMYRQAMFERRVTRGDDLHFESWIENVGVAPLYRDTRFALRFRQGEHEWIQEVPQQTVATWLPGDTWVKEEIALPGELKTGYVKVAAGLLLPGTHDVHVRFAVEEQFLNGWVDLGGFEVIANSG